MPEQPARRSGPRFPGVTRLVEELAADGRFMARTLRSNRGFAAAAILSLALGVGANTAIFSVVNALLLRPVPYADAGPTGHPLEPVAGSRHHRGLVFDGAVLRHPKTPHGFEQVGHRRRRDTST